MDNVLYRLYVEIDLYGSFIKFTLFVFALVDITGQ